MPLTSKGKKILRSMRNQYGPEKAKKVFYASKNKGKISGVDEHMDTYKHIGYILAEALGLIEARRVHVVGSQKDARIEHPDYLTVPAKRGEPGTGKGGRPERQYHRTQSMDITRPGPHSTGGSERGKKKEKVK